MSSFVIGKREYMKAAGLIAGMMSVFKEMWLYDEQSRGRVNENGLKRMFAECYEMNAESVAEQYGDPMDDYYDDDDYKNDFDDYMIRGVTIAISKDGLKEAIAELMMFFRSSMYQTERDDYAEKMQLLYDRIIVLLTGELLRSVKTDSYGELNVKAPEYRYERII